MTKNNGAAYRNKYERKHFTHINFNAFDRIGVLAGGITFVFIEYLVVFGPCNTIDAIFLCIVSETTD